MRKTSSLIAGLGLGLSIVSATASAEDSGWFFGVSGGQAELADLSKAALDELVLDEFFFAGAPVISGSSSLDERDTSFSLFGGYRFSQYVAVEAGYVDFGRAKYRASGIIDPIGPEAPLDATYSADFDASGITAAVLGNIPLGAMFDLHGRIGVLFADTEITERATVSTFSESETYSADSQDFFYGLGLGMHIGHRWSFSLDWQQFNDVGDEDKTGESDVNRLSLGVTYRL